MNGPHGSSPSICFIILDHRCDEYFADLVTMLRRFCPSSAIAWYDSGGVAPSATVHKRLGVPVLPCSHPLEYAKVTSFFLDAFEWASAEPYDIVVNVETDVALVSNGFEEFVIEVMRRTDYLVPRFERHVNPSSRWRPYRSLRSERAELLSLLGVGYLHRGFSPAQVFSRSFIDRVLCAPFYGDLRAFVDRNRAPGRSFSLQEILFPTLADVVGARVAGYSAEADRANRYRPYHSATSIRAAAAHAEVHLVHPVRRDTADPARVLVRSLARTGGE